MKNVMVLMVGIAVGLGCKDKEGVTQSKMIAAAGASTAATETAPETTPSATLFHDPGEIENVTLPLSVGGGYLAYEAEGEVFETSDRIMVVPTTGRAPAKARQIGPPSLYSSPTIDGDHVYYFDHTKSRWGLWRAPLNGGDPQRLTEGVTGHLVFAEQTIYIIDDDRVIWKLPRAGGKVQRSGVIGEHPNDTLRKENQSTDSAERITGHFLGTGGFDGGFSSYADGKLYRIASYRAQKKREDGRAVWTSVGWIDSVPVTGGTPELIVGNIERPGPKLQIVGDSLYFTAEDDQDRYHFHRARRADGKVERVDPISTHFNVYRFNITDGTVYASAFVYENWLVRWNLDGTGYTKLTDDHPYSETLPVHDGFVYWAGQDNIIRRRPI